MTTEEYEKGTYWEGEGLLWKRIIVWLDGKNVKASFRDARNFMTDKEIVYNETDFTSAIEKAVTYDSEFYDHLELYAEEG